MSAINFKKESYSVLTRICFQRIISFNYTNTYPLYYAKLSRRETFYIHGYADEGENKIIMGYSRNMIHLSAKGKEMRKELEKGYQRTKQGSLKYIDFIKKEEVILYIWGHSLSNIDKEILSFLFNESKKIILFYRNLNHKATLEKVIKKEYGFIDCKKIQYKDQIDTLK